MATPGKMHEYDLLAGRTAAARASLRADTGFRPAAATVTLSAQRPAKSMAYGHTAVHTADYTPGGVVGTHWHDTTTHRSGDGRALDPHLLPQRPASVTVRTVDGRMLPLAGIHLRTHGELDLRQRVCELEDLPPHPDVWAKYWEDTCLITDGGTKIDFGGGRGGARGQVAVQAPLCDFGVTHGGIIHITQAASLPHKRRREASRWQTTSLQAQAPRALGVTVFQERALYDPIRDRARHAAEALDNPAPQAPEPVLEEAPPPEGPRPPAWFLPPVAGVSTSRHEPKRERRPATPEVAKTPAGHLRLNLGGAERGVSRNIGERQSEVRLPGAPPEEIAPYWEASTAPLVIQANHPWQHHPLSPTKSQGVTPKPTEILMTEAGHGTYNRPYFRQHEQEQRELADQHVAAARNHLGLYVVNKDFPHFTRGLDLQKGVPIDPETYVVPF